MYWGTSSFNKWYESFAPSKEDTKYYTSHELTFRLVRQSWVPTRRVDKFFNWSNQLSKYDYTHVAKKITPSLWLQCYIIIMVVRMPTPPTKTKKIFWKKNSYVTNKKNKTLITSRFPELCRIFKLFVNLLKYYELNRWYFGYRWIIVIELDFTWN